MVYVPSDSNAIPGATDGPAGVLEGLQISVAGRVCFGAQSGFANFTGKWRQMECTGSTNANATSRVVLEGDEVVVQVDENKCLGVAEIRPWVQKVQNARRVGFMVRKTEPGGTEPNGVKPDQRLVCKRLFPDEHLPGKNLRAVNNVADIVTCERHCLAEPECKGFVYWGYSGDITPTSEKGNCELKRDHMHWEDELEQAIGAYYATGCDEINDYSSQLSPIAHHVHGFSSSSSSSSLSLSASSSSSSSALLTTSAALSLIEKATDLTLGTPSEEKKEHHHDHLSLLQMEKREPASGGVSLLELAARASAEAEALSEADATHNPVLAKKMADSLIFNSGGSNGIIHHGGAVHPRKGWTHHSLHEKSRRMAEEIPLEVPHEHEEKDSLEPTWKEVVRHARLKKIERDEEKKRSESQYIDDVPVTGKGSSSMQVITGRAGSLTSHHTIVEAPCFNSAADRKLGDTNTNHGGTEKTVNSIEECVIYCANLKQHDGTNCEGWDIVGLTVPSGTPPQFNCKPKSVRVTDEADLTTAVGWSHGQWCYPEIDLMFSEIDTGGGCCPGGGTITSTKLIGSPRCFADNGFFNTGICMDSCEREQTCLFYQFKAPTNDSLSGTCCLLPNCRNPATGKCGSVGSSGWQSYQRLLPLDNNFISLGVGGCCDTSINGVNNPAHNISILDSVFECKNDCLTANDTNCGAISFNFNSGKCIKYHDCSHILVDSCDGENGKNYEAYRRIHPHDYDFPTTHDYENPPAGDGIFLNNYNGSSSSSSSLSLIQLQKPQKQPQTKRIQEMSTTEFREYRQQSEVPSKESLWYLYAGSSGVNQEWTPIKASTKSLFSLAESHRGPTVSPNLAPNNFILLDSNGCCDTPRLSTFNTTKYIGTKDILTIHLCKEACGMSVDCKGMSFAAKTGTCLAYSDCDSVPVKSFCGLDGGDIWESHKKVMEFGTCKRAVGHIYAGTTMPSPYDNYSTAFAETCSSLCASLTTCKSWIFWRKIKKCVLKSTFPHTEAELSLPTSSSVTSDGEPVFGEMCSSSSVGAQAGSSNAAPIDGEQYSLFAFAGCCNGTDMSQSHQKDSLDECKTLCDAENLCHAMSYSTSSRECVLHTTCPYMKDYHDCGIAVSHHSGKKQNWESYYRVKKAPIPQLHDYMYARLGGCCPSNKKVMSLGPTQPLSPMQTWNQTYPPYTGWLNQRVLECQKKCDSILSCTSFSVHASRGRCDIYAECGTITNAQCEGTEKELYHTYRRVANEYNLPLGFEHLPTSTSCVPGLTADRDMFKCQGTSETNYPSSDPTQDIAFRAPIYVPDFMLSVHLFSAKNHDTRCSVVLYTDLGAELTVLLDKVINPVPVDPQKHYQPVFYGAGRLPDWPTTEDPFDLQSPIEPGLGVMVVGASLFSQFYMKLTPEAGTPSTWIGPQPFRYGKITHIGFKPGRMSNQLWITTFNVTALLPGPLKDTRDVCTGAKQSEWREYVCQANSGAQKNELGVVFREIHGGNRLISGNAFLWTSRVVITSGSVASSGLGVVFTVGEDEKYVVTLNAPSPNAGKVILSGEGNGYVSNSWTNISVDPNLNSSVLEGGLLSTVASIQANTEFTLMVSRVGEKQEIKLNGQNLPLPQGIPDIPGQVRSIGWRWGDSLGITVKHFNVTNLMPKFQVTGTCSPGLSSDASTFQCSGNGNVFGVPLSSSNFNLVMKFTSLNTPFTASADVGRGTAILVKTYLGGTSTGGNTYELGLSAANKGNLDASVKGKTGVAATYLSSDHTTGGWGAQASNPSGQSPLTENKVSYVSIVKKGQGINMEVDGVRLSTDALPIPEFLQSVSVKPGGLQMDVSKFFYEPLLPDFFVQGANGCNGYDSGWATFQCSDEDTMFYLKLTGTQQAQLSSASSSSAMMLTEILRNSSTTMTDLAQQLVAEVVETTNHEKTLVTPVQAAKNWPSRQQSDTIPVNLLQLDNQEQLESSDGFEVDSAGSSSDGSSDNTQRRQSRAQVGMETSSKRTWISANSVSPSVAAYPNQNAFRIKVMAKFMPKTTQTGQLDTTNPSVFFLGTSQIMPPPSNLKSTGAVTAAYHGAALWGTGPYSQNMSLMGQGTGAEWPSTISIGPQSPVLPNQTTTIEAERTPNGEVCLMVNGRQFGQGVPMIQGDIVSVGFFPGSAQITVQEWSMRPYDAATSITCTTTPFTTTTATTATSETTPTTSTSTTSTTSTSTSSSTSTTSTSTSSTTTSSTSTASTSTSATTSTTATTFTTDTTASTATTGTSETSTTTTSETSTTTTNTTATTQTFSTTSTTATTTTATTTTSTSATTATTDTSATTGTSTTSHTTSTSSTATTNTTSTTSQTTTATTSTTTTTTTTSKIFFVSFFKNPPKYNN